MTEWKTVRIGDVCEIVNGFAFDSKLFNSDKNGVPLIRIRDLVRGFSKTYTTENADSRFLVKVGDLLIGMDGEFNCSLWKSVDSFLNQRVCKIIPNLELIHKDYVYYGLQGKLKEIEDKTSFVTVKHISSKQIENIVLTYPPLETQKQIVVQLDKCKTLIDKHKQILEKYDMLIKSRFIEMFGDNPTENGKWNIEKLEDVCTVTSSKRIYAEEQSTSGVPFLRISDLVSRINGNPINDLFIPNSKFKEFQTKGLVPSVDDILITSRGTLGLCYIIKPEDKFYFQDGMITWLAFENHNKVLSVFIDWLFKSVLKTKIDNETNGATVKYVSISDLKKLQIPVPPLELQNDFAAFVQQIDKSKITVQKSLEKAETLYKSLMQEYFG